MITVKEVVLSMNTIESTKKWQEDEALRRFRLISPILDESLDPAKRLQVRKAIAEKALTLNTGARGLRAILESSMTDVMYEVPSNDQIKKVTITKETSSEGAEPICE